MLLVDYDVSSGWANWQYVAGVGNDPRSGIRIFNPVKQAVEYDKDGQYVRSWVPEVSKLERIDRVFQAWTASEEDIRAAGLEGNVMVMDPVKRIEFTVDGKPRAHRRGNESRGQRRTRKGGRAGNPTNPATGEVAETSSHLVEKEDGEPGSSSEPSTAVTVSRDADTTALPSTSRSPVNIDAQNGQSGDGPRRGGHGPRGSSARGRRSCHYDHEAGAV